MNQKSIIRYISTIYRSYRKSSELDSVFLDFLELFAWEKYLSAYKIYSELKSTDLKMAYKNVNKRVYALLSLNLIQEIETNEDNKNKHNAKYYKLSEYGIYQLFLKRLEALLVNPLELKKSNNISFNPLTFFRNYSNSILFESFIYSYFEKDTLFAIGNYLLSDLYHYLANCCSRMEMKLKYSNIQVVDTIFSWNKIPGKHNKNLLLHLKEAFNLENIDPSKIEKKDVDDTTISVETPSAYISIKLDKKRKKAIAMSIVNSQYKELEYDISQIGSDIVVSKPIPYEGIVNDAKKQIDQLIYEFICDLASATNSERSKEISYYSKILSEDKKFMSTVKEIYENRHKDFEQGYRMLRNYNR